MANKTGSQAKRRYFTCPSCRHSFRMRTGGNATCTKCAHRFVGRDNIASAKAKKEVLERTRYFKKQNILKRHPGAAKPQSPTAIRGDQVPTVKAEAKFKSRAIAKGYEVHRPSWPDYLLEKDGKLLCVEVKGNKDTVSKEQAQTFTLLESHGIPVYIWKDIQGARENLIRWGNGDRAKKVANRNS